jgi:hypothetical protein
MHHGGATILRQRFLKRRLIADISLDHGRRFAANLLDSLERLRAAVGEVVEYDDLLVCQQQGNTGM